MLDDAESIGESIRSYLGMPLRPVGVKIYQSETNQLARPEKPIHYCRAVREAAKGKEFFIKLGDEACAEAEVVLGFRDPKYVDIELRIKTRTKGSERNNLYNAPYGAMV